MDKVKHALGLDKSGSGGAQGMGDNRLDGHNTYDAKAGGSGVHTAGHHNTAAGGVGQPGYNSNQGVGMTNAATTGTGAGYQEHHAQHEKHHGHHTASGAVAGGLVGGPPGAVVGGVAGHEMGERGQHGHHNQHATTTTGTHGHDGQQKEGMMHKIERKMGMDPETRELKKEEKAMHQQHGGNQTGILGQHTPGAGGVGTHTNSGMMNDNLTGTGVTQGHHHQGGMGSGLTGNNTTMGSGMTGQTGNVQTVPVSNIREQAGGFTQGTTDSRGNIY